MNVQTKKKILFLGAFLLVLSIPLTIGLLRQKQESRSHASASTTLTFSPDSSDSNPLQKQVGDQVPLDVQVDPGSNLVSFVRLQVQYDPTKLELDQTNPFTLNTAAFSTKVEGPLLGDGTFAETVSIGADPTKAISTATKVGTINFKAIGNTNGTPTVVKYGTQTLALSVAAADQANENVISTTTPAEIVIGGDTISEQPSGGPTTTLVSFTMLLHGVGAAGDNPNPTGNSFSVKNPLHPQRNLDVEIYDNNNNLISSASGAIVYNATSGTFIGKLDLGSSFQTGTYVMKLKSDRYLRKRVPGILRIVNLQDNPVPTTELVAGDVNGDNTLNVLDYNALLDCGFGLLHPLPMADPNSVYNSQACQVHAPTVNVDVDDNGIINSSDYNLFLRELSVQNGD